MGQFLSKSTFAVCLLVFGYLIFFVGFANLEKTIARTSDDAAYYFKIAENVVSGHGSTFDGIGRTNGYHPVWLVILLPIAGTLRSDPEVMFRAYLLWEIIIIFAASILLFSVYSKIYPGYVTFFSASVFVFMVFFPYVNGMETGVMLLGLVSLFVLAFRKRIFTDHVPGHEFIFGLILGLTILSRLDLVWLGPSVFGLCIYLSGGGGRARRHTGLIRLSFICAGAVVVVVPYLLFNAVSFGAVVPISGILKSSFPAWSFDGAKFKTIGFLNIFFISTAFFYLIWIATRRRRWGEIGAPLACFRGAMVVLAATMLLHFIHTVLFMDWGLLRWHFLPYAFFAAMVVGEPVFFVLSRPRFARSRKIFVVLCVLLLVLGGARMIKKTIHADTESNWHVRSYRAALWARSNTAPDDVFAMKDAGNFGYFSGRTVINLDGLVNDFEYQDVFKEKTMNAYLARRSVKYLVQHGLIKKNKYLLNEVSGGTGDFNGGDYDTVSLRYYGHMHKVYSDPIVVKRANEVYRDDPGSESPPRAFVIWRIGGDR